MFSLIVPVKFARVLPNLTSVVEDRSHISIKFLWFTYITFLSTVIFLSSVSLIYIIWRIWLFKILPQIHPHEPKELPYWIPQLGIQDPPPLKLNSIANLLCIGHTNGFLKDPDRLLAYARNYFNNCQEPFALRIAGQTLYVLTSPEDVKAAQENTETLKQYELTRELALSMGLTPAVEHRISQGLSYPHEALDAVLLLGNVKNPLIQRQVPEKLCSNYQLSSRKLSKEFSLNVSRLMQWEGLSAKYTTLISPEEKDVSLLIWCREVIVKATTMTYFDEALLQIEPNLPEVFSDFEEESIKFLATSPVDPLNLKSAAKWKGIRVFKAYFSLPKAQRLREAQFVCDLETEYRSLGFKEEDIATMMWAAYWIINANTYKLAFWLLSYLLHNPSHLLSVHNELALQQSPSLDKSPLFTASLNETLRLTSAPCTLHNILAPTVIGSKRFSPGSNFNAKILVPYSQLHLSEEIFGSNVNDFVPSRFLQNPKLLRSEVFGGGVGTMVAAKKAVLVFANDALGRFMMTIVLAPPCGPPLIIPSTKVERDVEKGDKVSTTAAAWPLPRLGETRGSLGVVGPMKGDDTTLRLTRR